MIWKIRINNLTKLKIRIKIKKISKIKREDKLSKSWIKGVNRRMRLLIGSFLRKRWWIRWRSRHLAEATNVNTTTNTDSTALNIQSNRFLMKIFNKASSPNWKHNKWNFNTFTIRKWLKSKIIFANASSATSLNKGACKGCWAICLIKSIKYLLKDWKSETTYNLKISTTT